MNKKQIIEKAEENLFHVYNRFPVVFDYGKGVHLYDEVDEEYLDFASGIGVMAFGYGNEDYENALISQIKRITHTSNLYYHQPMIEAAEKLCRASGMDKVFFTNSGAEAIEGALKTAKKYAYNKSGAGDYEIIAMENSFHGRTVGSLSVTGTDHYREPFYPLMSGVKFATFNDFGSVLANLTDKTCAIIMETVQGEGGLYPADKEFITKVRNLCDEEEILLILDEVQCGMGRTGSMYAYQQYGIKPDILTTAKALGNGVPVGAFAVTKDVAENSLVPGDHGTTYGGNPLCTAAVSQVFDMFEDYKLIDHVNKVAAYFEQVLDAIVAKYDFVTGRRGLGLMQGLVLTIPVKEVVTKALLDEHLIVLSAGSDVLRLLPPLVITEQDVDEFKKKIEKVLDTFL
ncbi:MAG: aspartate aminotransferase family protein [Pseudobutyrivibrio sp.]|uniref:aspartate aminotransferase family protein n=1 Tax=Pseudobutyrivibrio sp. TaxID=2014367 RepID=UPI001B0C1AC0|nr:aspartate aminotransferase family protein [Pseudobutyrivibrio sp.]MBO5617263.1 aspartate aminotransferase family protein [Pseudobutyrivibrio sp.]MBO6284338.1 aspartate aminotransferase family protein [Pseudobutyrivibrio sp.]MBP3263368.1 aspartate aminotransferase family protein [Pseudobutyrivibrio sp.]